MHDDRRLVEEIQFRHVHRPTYTNTEPGIGVGVLSDSDYGHDITRHGRATSTGSVMHRCLVRTLAALSRRATR